MLKPADVLVVEETTNGVDIPTLEILEESLLEYRGALVLVTHDRYMLDRVSTVVLGLDGLGGAERFADYAQWEIWQRGQLTAAKSGERAGEKNKAAGAGAGSKKKLSYKETRELETMEERIAEAEKELRVKHELLLDPQAMTDPLRFRK